MGSGQLHSLTTLPVGKQASVSTEQKVRLAPEPVWTQWQRENYPSFAPPTA